MIDTTKIMESVELEINERINSLRSEFDGKIDSLGKSFVKIDGTNNMDSLTIGYRLEDEPIGEYSFSQGQDNIASGHSSHAQGYYNIVRAEASHAEGLTNTIEEGAFYSHAEGYGNIVTGMTAHAEGSLTIASGDYSHSQGSGTHAGGMNSHAEGLNTIAVNALAFARVLSVNEGSNYGEFIIESELVNNDSTIDWYMFLGAKVIISANTSDEPIVYSVEAEITGVDGSGGLIIYTDYDDFYNTAWSHMILKNIDDYIVSTHAEGINTFALGNSSHSEGYGSIAIGDNSHAEGNQTEALGDSSHSEGRFNIASGDYSHAEGDNNVVYGTASHAEGTNNFADGIASHVEGSSNIAGTGFSHAKGRFNVATNGTLYKVVSTANSSKTIKLDKVTNLKVGTKIDIKRQNTTPIIDTEITAIDSDTNIITVNTTENITASRYVIVRSNNINNPSPTYAEGINNVATGQQAHAEGSGVVASGTNSHAEGSGVIASGQNSHAEGNTTTASANNSHAEGYLTTASGVNSHAEGYKTVASGTASHAEGNVTTASGNYSHAKGDGTTASVYASTAIGKFNKEMLGGVSDTSNENTDAFVIGNGTSSSELSNAFRVMFNGATYGAGAYNTTGADYAEFFEWLDGNQDNEDRVGYVVTLNGGKIVKAKSSDNYILGVISSTPSVVGDSYQDDWSGRYVKDEWERIVYKEQDIPHVELDENGDEITVIKRASVPVINPKWNNEEGYIPREKRKEWSAVGLVGKLLVRDDGSCQIDGFAKVGKVDGEITSSEEPTNMRVMERVAPNIVRVFIK